MPSLYQSGPEIWSASPTPFLDNGALDDAALERLVAQHRKLKLTGLFLGGTSGEGPFMPNAQRADLVRKVKRIAGTDFHLAVQVSDTSSARVRENMDQAVAAGADSVVIAAPWIRPFVNHEFARRYFLQSIEHRCPVPVGIYVLTQPAETGIDREFWAEMMAHPRVAYAKDSSMSEDYRRAFLAVKARRSGLRLLTGYEFDIPTYLQDGYDGAIVGTAILNGGLIRRAVEAFGRGDPDGARTWQDRSNRLLYDLFRPDIASWMAGLKYALRRLGLFSTEFSHLVYPLDDDDRRRIDAALERDKEYL